MVWGLKQLSEGPAAWAAFLELLKSPASIVFQLLTLAFATYHSITWFNLTPKALPCSSARSSSRMGHRRSAFCGMGGGVSSSSLPWRS